MSEVPLVTEKGNPMGVEKKLTHRQYMIPFYCVRKHGPRVDFALLFYETQKISHFQTIYVYSSC